MCNCPILNIVCVWASISSVLMWTFIDSSDEIYLDKFYIYTAFDQYIFVRKCLDKCHTCTDFAPCKFSYVSLSFRSVKTFHAHVTCIPIFTLWVLIHLFKFLFRRYVFRQTSQKYDFLPICIRSWHVKELFLLNVFRQASYYV